MSKTIITAASLAAVLAVSGYAVADIADVAPGVLTDEPRPPTPAPFPTPQVQPLPQVDNIQTELADSAAPPDSAALTTAIQNILGGTAGNAGGLGPSYSVLVQDALTGKDVVTLNADNALVPASVVKILTSVAAVAELGPDWRAETVVTTGQNADEIVLRGGGDVLLAAGAGNPQQASGYAGLGDLAAIVAENLRAQGTTTVSVVIDDSNFTGPTMAPEWKQQDVTAGFIAPVTALAVDAGRVVPGRYAKRHLDPGLAAAGDFVTQLKQRGINVPSAPQRQERSGSSNVLGKVRSAPLSDVATYVLQTSDNTAAEALARHVARKRGAGVSFAESGQTIGAVLKDLGVATNGLVLSDGSGMSKSSRVSARTIAQSLALAAGNEHTSTRTVVTGLPVAGVQGTLAERFGAQPHAKGVARAKTGTLSGVTALAGVVRTSQGRLLTYAILADQVPNTASGRKTSDQIVGTLAQ